MFSGQPLLVVLVILCLLLWIPMLAFVLQASAAYCYELVLVGSKFRFLTIVVFALCSCCPRGHLAMAYWRGDP